VNETTRTAQNVKVLFVCDGGAQVGGGHVMRSLTLADALTQEGAQCAFLESQAIAPVLERFAGPHVARVTDAAAFVSDWVVLDSYRTTLDEETGWRSASRLAVIDDLARLHAADLVIDPGFGRDPAAYAPAQALTGPRFALVRPGFAALRAKALARRGQPVRRALVAFGLTDVDRVTARAVERLLKVAGEVALDVVAGSAAPSLPVLRALADAGRIELHIDVRDMAALSAQADIAVGAGGGSIWERAVLGLPSIVLALADNQIPMTRALDEAGALMEADLDALGDAWTQLVSSPERRTAMAARAAALCDGLGAPRVAQALMAFK
jgi:UDP-2,4-diacetamido-2,4,6-trideoxy-beta-L-altropyranose hydrolase